MSDSEESVDSEQEANLSDGSADGEPQQAPVSSEEEEEEEEEDVPVKRRKLVNDEEDDEENEEEEEEEEEDEDDEEEEEVSRKKGKKKKRSRRRPTGRDFIQDDVEVDDDEEEDDYDYPDDDDIYGISTNERAEAERFLREQEMVKERRRNKYADMTEEEMERYFQERHAAQSVTHRGDVDDDAYDDITQNGLLPSNKDPNLWIVKCRMGEEKSTALLLMRKYLVYQHKENPLEIKAVIVKEGIKGMLYIEAYKKSHVEMAIEGISAINKYNITMVKINEMVDTLRVVKDIPVLKKGTYVRLKRTMYKDDLGQVDWVDIAQNRVNLKLVPRVDYTRMRGAMRNSDEQQNKNRRRPQPKLFDVEKIKQIGGEVTYDGDFVIFEGGHFRNGFLYKSFPINAILVDGVKPSLTELERFQESADDLQKELKSTSVREKGNTFAPGDNIEVIEGELMNLRGKVMSVDGDEVVILPDHEDLKDPLRLNASEMRKYFREGDHVRVINGRYEGNTGLILRVDDNRVFIFADVTSHELEVLADHVQLCADVATGVDSIGQYQFQDLVNLDKETVGVIVRLERDHVEVLTMHGQTTSMKPQAIYRKHDSKFAKALDANKNSLQVGDLVRVIDGPNANKRDVEEDKQGEIIHIYRTWVFLRSRMHVQHGGIFVCKARHLSLMGAKTMISASSTGGGGLNSSFNANLLRSPHPLSSPHPDGMNTPSNASQSNEVNSIREVNGVGAAPFGMGGNVREVRRDMGMIGKSVRIIRGTMKTYTGIVKDATEKTVRIELHAIPQIKNFDRSDIRVIDAASSGASNAMSAPTFAQTPSASGWGAGAQTPMYGAGAQTPMYGAQTPMHGAQTPMYGAQTPMYGAQTPMYGAQTPMHSGGDMLGGGSRTPMYDIGSANATPRHESGSSSFTPKSDYQNSSSFTPKSNYQSPARFNSTPKSDTNASTPSSFVPKTDFRDCHMPSYLVSGEWITSDVLIRINSKAEDSRLHGVQTNVNREGQKFTVSMELDDDFVDAELDPDQIEPVPPAMDDAAVVIYGSHRGEKGRVVSVDGSEAVLRWSDGSMQPVPVSILCKCG